MAKRTSSGLTPQVFPQLAAPSIENQIRAVSCSSLGGQATGSGQVQSPCRVTRSAYSIGASVLTMLWISGIRIIAAANDFVGPSATPMYADPGLLAGPSIYPYG